MDWLQLVSAIQDEGDALILCEPIKKVTTCFVSPGLTWTEDLLFGVPFHGLVEFLSSVTWRHHVPSKQPTYKCKGEGDSHSHFLSLSHKGPTADL